MGGIIWEEELKPCLAMVVAQFIHSLMTILAKEAFNHGFSSMVFVVYRHSIGALLLFPVTFIAKRGKVKEMAPGLAGFLWILLGSLVGITTNQILLYHGIDLSSATMAMTIQNSVPAITFVMGASLGLEKVDLKSLRTVAKIGGTVICVGGAVSMIFVKGPKILNMSPQQVTVQILSSELLMNKWILGGFCLLGAHSCWSLWLILQVQMCKYTEPLLVATWTSFLAASETAIITYFTEPQLSRWKITSSDELIPCLFAGIFGSGITFYLQSWCISKRGPLYSAMFSPLSTLITIVLASIMLHEEFYIGSLICAIVIIGGLYMVLWGKAEEVKTKEDTSSAIHATGINISIDPQADYSGNTTEEPLLHNN
ncbi:WAT1-related protein [Rhynchospora pubera]|uniref:WAT1-related protein n=1 Tax=Rhynchospora pubera TaxID=906938 RepID=A0AAV8FQV5_9POAL|nr:WAT1-related protein [Rhynchospora pubera]KAJ4792647.1 WAT1-related protein [Rhynchospora pubera]